MTYAALKNVHTYYCAQDQNLLICNILESKYAKYKLNPTKLELVSNKIKTTLEQMQNIESSKDSKYFILPLEHYSLKEKKIELSKSIKCKIYPIDCLGLSASKEIDFEKTKENILAYQKTKDSALFSYLWLYSWGDIMNSKLLVLDTFSQLDYCIILSNLFWDITYLGFDKRIVEARRKRQMLLHKMQCENSSAYERLIG
ncbi:MAG: hypothetical protein HUJ63_05790, partial [Enterococcus sp.]|nr:hypothetical protein [Enterococcus sp.]